MAGSLVALDVETKCAIGCKERCEHGLDPYRNAITVVGLHYKHPDDTSLIVERCLRQLGPRPQDWSLPVGFRLVGHNLKFDLHTLYTKGFNFTERWEDDTLLMAATLTEKVSPEYLEWYAQERKRRNKLLPKGVSHRDAGPHSLKTLAPYFLGVEAFWEDPANHDNDEYVLKDCEYTYRLKDVLEEKLKKEGSYDFYKNRFLPWCKMILRAEIRGVKLDLTQLELADKQAKEEAREAKRILDELWAPAYQEYKSVQLANLQKEYGDMLASAVHKIKAPSPAKEAKTRDRYLNLYHKAAEKIEPLNLDSPTQLNWLLKDHLQLDITDFDGDESTGKPVLQRLAGQGRADIKQLLRYRHARKLTTSFFPTYREHQVNGVIHPSFNPTGTRTGRLSCSNPNLQQVERNLKSMFIPRPGYKFIIKDAKSIEPNLILYYTHDKNLWRIHSEGKDFHNYNTAQFFEGLDPDDPEFKVKYELEREVGKEVGLALMYGAGTNRLMESAQKRGFVWSRNEAYDKLNRFKDFYKSVFEFRERVINPALREGALTNLLGRSFKISDPQDVHMQGLNTLIQGSASDLVLHSALKASQQYKTMNMDAQPIIFEHDLVIVEVIEGQADEAENVLERAMTDYELTIPQGKIKLGTSGGIRDFWQK